MEERAKLNKILFVCYETMVVILALAYILEFFKGARTIPYIIMFLLIDLVPGAVSGMLYFKDRANALLAAVIAYGFLIMYVFVIFTTFRRRPLKFWWKTSLLTKLPASYNIIIVLYQNRQDAR